MSPEIEKLQHDIRELSDSLESLQYTVAKKTGQGSTLEADLGTLGSWRLGTNSITAGEGSATVGLDATVTAGDDVRIYAGSATPSSAPFRVTEAGALTATSATISGSITATTGAIGGFSIGTDYIKDAADSMGMASTVTGGDDVRFWAGDTFANRATADFRVTEAGAVTASSFTMTGGSLSGIVNSTATDISLLTASHSLVFSSTDLNTIAWASGTINLSNGRTFSIDAGNTGNMAALTYVYLDTAVSSTVLQTTTTYSTAIGANKLLIGTAQNQAVAASFIPFQAGQPVISGDQLQALSVQSASIANLAVTNAKINDLAVSKLTAGTITSQSINMAVSDGSGDVEIRSGIATGDFANTGAANGFILGVDDSDSNKAKFYFGSPTGNVKYDGTTFSVTGVSNVKATYTAGEAITAGQAVSAGYYIAGGNPSYDNSFSTATGTTNGSGVYTQSFTVGSNSNRILIVQINNIVNSTNVTSIAYNGTAMTAILNDTTNDQYVYYLMAPATGANNLTFTGAVSDANYKVTIYSFYNVNQTALVAADYATTWVNTTSVSVAVTPAVDGAMVLGMINSQFDTTPTGTWYKENFQTNNGDHGDTGIVVPATAVTVSATAPSGVMAAAAIVLRPIATLVYGVLKSDANDGIYNNAQWEAFLGFAAENISAGSTGQVIISGEVTGLSSIVFGEQYYLSDTAGAISVTPGSNTRKVGIGLSTTSLLITNVW